MYIDSFVSLALIEPGGCFRCSSLSLPIRAGRLNVLSCTMYALGYGRWGY